MGEINFSFYMVHYLVVNYVGLLGFGSMVQHLVTLTGSILLSSVIYLMYEEPMRKKIRFGDFNPKRPIEQQYNTVSP
ncbi:hypothetical protein SD71_13955 [Cohnella kolymensis]|uniref:Acyltransferase 3 domain-containing protein n=1 Tax=Cohnella kolymensis TaxID=1590652 RepID=A0ABR5A324_9BACL|nr:hypothetical protein [Cohnella kolymensis]KIL35405.1 hypothetical protein SD71_13955 [Cohnella kolymensis]